MNTIDFEYEHLRNQFETSFVDLLPEEAKSNLFKLLIREILVMFVLQPLMNMLSDPDFWNQRIDEYATRAIKEQKMVNRLREALDKPFSEHSLDRKKSFSRTPSFDKYLGMIKSCKNLLEAKRIHHSITSEIIRKKLVIENKSDKDLISGRRVEELKKYINRLKIAQKRVERKILDLGGTVSVDPNPILADHFHSSAKASPISPNADLINISHLLREPALSYFREYMEKKQEIDVLQFYCAVEAFFDLSQASNIDSFSNEETEETSAEVETRRVIKSDLLSLFSSHFVDAKNAKKLIFKLDLIPNDIKSLHRDILMAKLTSDKGINMGIEFFQYCQEKSKDYMRSFVMPFSQSDLYIKLISDPDFVTLKKSSITNSIPQSPKRTIHSIMGFFRSASSSNAQSPESKTADHQSVSSPLFNSDTSTSPILAPPRVLNLRHSPTPPIIITTTSASASTETDLFSTTPLPHTSLMNSPSAPVKRDVVELDTLEQVEKEFESILDQHDDSVHQVHDSDDLDMTGSEADLEELHFDDFSDTNSDAEEDNSGKRIPFVSEPEMSKMLTEEYEKELSRIETSLIRLRQQKSLLQMMSEKPVEKKDRQSAQREQKLLKKMQFQFEQEEKSLESEKKQLEWKIEGTMIIPNQTKISIPTFEVVEPDAPQSDEDSEKRKPYVVFFVEVLQPTGSGKFSSDMSQSGWMMTRRYSEFHAFHRHLKEAYPDILSKSKFVFPGKRYFTPSRVRTALFPGGSSMDSTAHLSPLLKDYDFIEQRRKALEKYVDELSKDEVIAKSWIFRQFLCENQTFTFGMRRLRDLMPKKFTLGGVISGITGIFKDDHEGTFEDANEENYAADIAKGSNASIDEEIFKFSNSKGVESLSSLLLELFDLHERSNWWRRQAITWVIQQFLGGTLERRITEFIQESLNEENLTHYLATFGDLFDYWKLNPNPLQRNPFQKTQSRLSVYKKLHLLIPDMSGSIVGKGNAKKGSTRLFEMLQNRRLNQDLVYRAVDSILKKLGE